MITKLDVDFGVVIDVMFFNRVAPKISKIYEY